MDKSKGFPPKEADDDAEETGKTSSRIKAYNKGKPKGRQVKDPDGFAAKINAMKKSKKGCK